MANLTPSPTIAIIDSNNVLTINWQPALVNGGYSAYQDWLIYLVTSPGGVQEQQTIGGQAPTGLETGGTVDSRYFSETVPSGEWGLTMTAVASGSSGYSNSPAWDFYHLFPTTLQSNEVVLSNTAVKLNQPFTISLDNAYTGAGFWRAIYQDGTNSGWLPISLRTIVKSFSSTGNQLITIQVQNDFSLNVPAVQLRRQIIISVYVMNQEYSVENVNQNNLADTLMLGGSKGFEITDTSTTSTLLNPYLVALRALVRDTTTNELKLLVTTSRYDNSSSLLGTLAADVFPIFGRPHVNELIELPIELSTGSDTSLVPVKISTNLLPILTLGQAVATIQLQATGGNTPYSWYADGLPIGVNLSIDGTLSGVPLELGIFNVNFSVKDSSSPEFIETTTLQLSVTSDLSITTSSLPSASIGVPYSSQVTANGGLQPYTWSVVSGSLAPGVLINPNTGLLYGFPVSYNSISDFSKTFIATIQVTDAVGAVASTVLSMSLIKAPLSMGAIDQQTIFVGQPFRLAAGIYGGVSPYTLTSHVDDGIISNPTIINGRVEFDVNATEGQEGVRTVEFSITDSSSTTGNFYLTYNIESQISAITFSPAEVDHWWYDGDSATSIVYVSTNLQGYLLNSIAPFSGTNGLIVSLNTSNNEFVVNGPPTAGSESNTELMFSAGMLLGNEVVATVSKEYSLLAHTSSTNVGTMTSITSTYLVGDFVTLNPLKPKPNSATFTFTTGDTVRVKSGYALPPGLSLDINTGLIYGTIGGKYSQNSILEYVNSGLVAGTVTLVWDIQTSDFAVTDNLTTGEIQSTYSGNLTSPVALQSVSVYKGHLPQGITYVLDSTTKIVNFSGKPTEAGYFDVVFSFTSSTSNVGYYKKRFVVDFIAPISIITSSFPPVITSQAYSQTLQAFGGIPPYTWSLASGTLPSSITLNASTGVLSGTTTDANGSNYTPTFQVQDNRSVTTTSTIAMTIENPLTVETVIIPTAVQNSAYSFQLLAQGGTSTGYTWTQTNSGSVSLPTGLTLNSAGLISGTPTVSSYTQTIDLQVTDSGSNTASANLVLKVVAAAPTIAINTAGVGAITRGAPYLGSMSVLNSLAAPFVWTIASNSPNPLPTGISLLPNSSNSGETAALAGKTTAVISSLGVTIQVTDNNGNSAASEVVLASQSSLSITSKNLPIGEVSSFYSYTLGVSGYNPSFTWAVSSGSLPTGLSLNSSTGVISGTPSNSGTSSFTIQVTDALADTATANLSIAVQSTTLSITNSSLATGTTGVSYSASLSATGGTPAYTFSVSPNSSSQLPTGISINGGGVIAGTSLSNFSSPILFRVVDSGGVIIEKSLTLTIGSGLTVKTGIDYTNSTSTNILGYVSTGVVDSILPRINNSFYIYATGVVSKDVSQFKVGITSATVTGITATVETISTGTARIRLEGNFKLGNAGSNSLSVSINDNGVTSSSNFTWYVYSNTALTLLPTSGSFPTVSTGDLN